CASISASAVSHAFFFYCQIGFRVIMHNYDDKNTIKHEYDDKNTIKHELFTIPI
ncbi:hypothetical protein ACJX0J_020275, partial [Zea mays]